MIINNNPTAVSAYNNSQISNFNAAKDVQKLSTGIRINVAGDDAAGLSISEKLRGQIRGLNQAASNVQDGISLVQTAESGMSEIHSMLQRIRELSVQSASGTMVDGDRVSVQQEVASLKNGITDIANQTQFNGLKLLNGTGASSGTDAPQPNGSKEIPGGIISYDQGVFSAATLSYDVSDATNTKKNHSSIDFSKTNDMWLREWRDSNSTSSNNAYVTIDWSVLSAAEKSALKKDLSSATLTELQDAAAAMEKGINQAISDYNSANSESFGLYDVTTDGSKMILTARKEGGVEIGFYGSSDDSVMSNTAGFGASGGYRSARNSTALQELQGSTLNVIVDGTQTLTATVTMDTLGYEAGRYNVAIVNAINDALQGAGYGSNIVDIYEPEMYGTNSTPSMAFQMGLSGPNGTAFLASHTIKFTNADGTAPSYGDGGVLSKLGYVYKGGNPVNSGGTASATFALQVGADSGNSMSFSINSATSSALGISAVDISTQGGAETAIAKLDTAIQTLSAQRANLGAVQNRLEHTLSNVTNTSENTQAAESRIRDTDMAVVYSQYSKEKVLQQASQQMISQALEQPKSTLNILS